MAISGVVKLACLVLACMVVVAPEAIDAIQCGDVVSKLAPCVSYLRHGSMIPGNCCSAVKSLNAAASTTADRQAACGCLKNAYNSISGIQAANAAALPGSCGVNLPYKISPSIDCSKVR